MAVSMYDLTVPVLLRGLNQLTSYLDKAEAHAAELKIDSSVLVNSRLAPDMMSLAGQIQRASDTAKAAVGRLAGVKGPAYADDERTIDDLKQRIAKTVEWLSSIPRLEFDGSASREIDFKFPGVSGPIRGEVYLVQFVLPNFFFHLSTAHGILRHNGVKIGKRDYIGSVG